MFIVLGLAFRVGIRKVRNRVRVRIRVQVRVIKGIFHISAPMPPLLSLLLLWRYIYIFNFFSSLREYK